MKVWPGTQPWAGSSGSGTGNGASADGDAEKPVTHGRPARAHGRGLRQVPVRQRVGGLLLAAACGIGAWWYVPRIVGADHHMLTGTVVSTGILDLNFADQADIATILVHPGERVSKGQRLAVEDAPAAAAIVRADRAAVTAQRAELNLLKRSGTPGAAAAIAAARAQLARDQATLATDEAAQAGAIVTAPAGGLILAVNGKPGETASADGVHDYLAQTQSTPVPQQPLFSLLPQGPQSGAAGSDSPSSQLPLIELRNSTAWEVVVLVPGNSTSTLRPGQEVTVSVPAAHLENLRGRAQRLPGASPVSTPSGVDYEMVVTIVGHPSDPPLAGMTADVVISG